MRMQASIDLAIAAGRAEELLRDRTRMQIADDEVELLIGVERACGDAHAMVPEEFRIDFSDRGEAYVLLRRRAREGSGQVGRNTTCGCSRDKRPLLAVPQHFDSGKGCHQLSLRKRCRMGICGARR